MPGEEEARNIPSHQFDAKSVADYWLTEAEESLRVAEHLVEKADYSYALFSAIWPLTTSIAPSSNVRLFSPRVSVNPA